MNAVIRVPVFVALAMVIVAFGAASRAAVAQVHGSSIDGSGAVVSIHQLQGVLSLAEIRIEPERLWRCHGEYLATVLEIHDQARAAAAPLEVDGTRFERAESVRKASAVMRQSMARHGDAIDRLVVCACAGMTEEQRSQLAALQQELRARWLQGLVRNFALVFHAGVTDAGERIDELPLELRRRPAVREALLASAPKRERTLRALLDAALENRRRMAEMGETLGIAGLSFELAMPIISAHEEAHRRAERDAHRDDPTYQYTTALEGFWELRESPAQAGAAAIQAQREPIEAAARVIPTEHASLLRRRFWASSFGLTAGLDDASWSTDAPNVPLAQWTARRVLTQPGVTGERRTEARRVLKEWLDAEDAFREKVALSALEALEKPGASSVQELLRPFDPNEEEHPELESLSLPFRRRLAAALGMPWIADRSLAPAAPPSAIEMTPLTADDVLITGTPGPFAIASLDPPGRARVDWHGRRTVGRDDVDAWARRLGAEEAMRIKLDRLVQEHRRAWDERVLPLATTASELRPGETRGERTFVSVRLDEPEPAGLEEWRERVTAAIEPLEAAADEIDATLFRSMRALLPESEHWRVDAIEFSRRADTVRSISYWRVSRRLVLAMVEPVGGLPVDPLEVIASARLGAEREAKAIRAVLPTLGAFAPIIERERALMLAFVRLAAEERSFAPQSEHALESISVQAPLLDLFSQWRRAESASMAALDEVLTPEELARCARAHRRSSFPGLYDASTQGSRVADELRRLAAADRDLERGMNAITTIDAAEAALASSIDRSVRSVADRWSAPAPKVESIAEFRQVLADRNAEAAVGARYLHWVRESERFAWYLARALPPEWAWSSPEFRLMAARSRLEPP